MAITGISFAPEPRDFSSPPSVPPGSGINKHPIVLLREFAVAGPGELALEANGCQVGVIRLTSKPSIISAARIWKILRAANVEAGATVSMTILPPRPAKNAKTKNAKKA